MIYRWKNVSDLTKPARRQSMMDNSGAELIVYEKKILSTGFLDVSSGENRNVDKDIDLNAQHQNRS